MATIKYAVRNDGIYGSYVEFDTLVEALEFKAMKGPGALVYEPLGLTAAKKVRAAPAAPAGDAAGRPCRLRCSPLFPSDPSMCFAGGEGEACVCLQEAELREANARLTRAVAELRAVLVAIRGCWGVKGIHEIAAAALAAADAPAVDQSDKEELAAFIEAWRGDAAERRGQQDKYEDVRAEVLDECADSIESLLKRWDAPAVGGSDALQAALDKSARCLRCNDTGKVPCVCKAEHAPAAGGEPATPYTSTPPTCGGPWWWRLDQASKPFIRDVYDYREHGGKLCCPGNDSVIPVDQLGGFWSGPVTPPGTAGGAGEGAK